MNGLLCYCRAGFEPELAGELTECAAEAGFAGYARTERDSGHVVFASEDAVALSRALPWSSLIFARQKLRLLALMKVSSGQQESFNAGVKSTRNNVIAIFCKLRAGQVESDIKHANPHITTALTGGWFYSSVVFSDASSSSSDRRPLPT